jgi:hypothetical protein
MVAKEDYIVLPMYKEEAGCLVETYESVENLDLKMILGDTDRKLLNSEMV